MQESSGFGIGTSGRRGDRFLRVSGGRGDGFSAWGCFRLPRCQGRLNAERGLVSLPLGAATWSHLRSGRNRPLFAVDSRTAVSMPLLAARSAVRAIHYVREQRSQTYIGKSLR